MRSFAETTANLRAARHSVRELRGLGCAALSVAGARLIGLAFSEDDENLLWTHPALSDAEAMRNPASLSGGIGGDRLWFAPEATFHWRGPPDWASFENYHVPVEADPGDYQYLDSDGGEIQLSMSTTLPTTDGSSPLSIFVRRAVRLVPPPDFAGSERLLPSLSYVGVEARHELELSAAQEEGVIGLWHLLQAPVGATAIIPSNAAWSGEPLSYANPGDWRVASDHVAWTYAGTANAKMGLGISAVTGRAGLVRQLADGRWSVLVRDFPVDRCGRYVDHPYGRPCNDQVVQAWDGFGFGELEFHGVGLDAASGPRSLTETDRIWAFGGPAGEIAAVGSALLGVEIVSYVSGGASD